MCAYSCICAPYVGIYGHMCKGIWAYVGKWAHMGIWAYMGISGHIRNSAFYCTNAYVTR